MNNIHFHLNENPIDFTFEAIELLTSHMALCGGMSRF